MLIIQLTPPKSFLGLHTDIIDLESNDQSVPSHARNKLQQEKSSFLKAAFFLFLSSHMICWIQQTHDLKADVVKYLRTLQVRDAELIIPHFIMSEWSNLIRFLPANGL